MTNVEEHEQGHYRVAKHYGLSPTLREREVALNVTTLPLDTYLCILVAGAVNEHTHFPQSLLLRGCGGDALLLCRALHGTNHVAYTTALACIIEKKDVRFCIPAEHVKKLKQAVQTSIQILKQEHYNASSKNL